MISSLLLVFVITLPVFAEETHHPGNQSAPVNENMNMPYFEALTQQMKEMREKVEMEKDPDARKELMSQHQQLMHDSIKMMTMMGLRAI